MKMLSATTWLLSAKGGPSNDPRLWTCREADQGSLIASSFAEVGVAVHNLAAPWTRRKVDQIPDCCQSGQIGCAVHGVISSSLPTSLHSEEAAGGTEIQSTPIVNSLN
jgi:hypothetical protein